MYKTSFFYLVFTCLLGCSAPENLNTNQNIYLFTYFVNEKDGMHMAVSDDGLNWYPLNDNQPVLKSVVGDSLLRDPSIIRDDKGTFHLVFTTSWTNLGFGYTHSSNLVDWAEQTFIPVDKGSLSDSVRNAWAPELFYDTKEHTYYIIWASAKNRIPALQTGFKGDHKQYFIKTTNFDSFSEPQLLFGEYLSDAAVIDCHVVQTDKLYHFFFKIEADNLIDGGKDGLYHTASPSLHGPYAEKQPIPKARGNSEGPSVVKVGDRWILYYDSPKGAATSTDLQNWEDISDQVNFPEGFRHGSVVTVPRSIITKNFALSDSINMNDNK
jgi:beta-galactosidase